MATKTKKATEATKNAEAKKEPSLVRLRVRTNQTGAKRTAIGLVFTGDWRAVDVERGHSAHKELLANAGLDVEEVSAATNAVSSETSASESQAAD